MDESALAATDHRPDLGGVTVPTLVLVGEHDVVTPAGRAQELASLIPHSELATVAGAGHLANQERPVVFNDLIEIFLKGHQP
jgi:pimeloyl-ACP methyl ester carboxylesterase